MVSRGRARKGCPQGTSQAPPGFDQQAFVEAMSTDFTTIAQTSTVEGRGGFSNLQRFKAHHPLTFMGGGDPMVADHLFRQIEKVLEAMEITFDVVKIILATF